MHALISVARRLALAATLLVVAAPLVVQAQDTPQRGGNLVMVVQPEPPTLASYISTSGPIGQVTAKVYDGLLEYDFDLQADPRSRAIVDGEPDGKTITFKLRKASSSTTASPSPAPTSSSRSWTC